MFKNRKSLWWLLGPVVLYICALPLYNRIEPIVLGLPFFMFWMLLATLLTPGFIWLAARKDPVWLADRARARGGADER
ncbi:DUF3311 domain-containing protein [Saccharopolyspora rectivirgula]|jgi:hypothetical protein|uniref:DUF3311 domain-containing protein n=1 Tax=Saccharopolyspora rectivirgula TaxID=28042 RepID=A0A073AUT3_9PSEU|nr:DUF3311 domain-containing protein [Saccharopolyspora rectivirgula]KEI43140.1 hypothetical protein GU90_18630 [Saccharopolyspora rectivirgula]